MSKIKITLNGEERIINSELVILDLINDLELDIEKIAIEKDLKIINNDEFDKVKIQDGAKIEIVHFIGGG